MGPNAIMPYVANGVAAYVILNTAGTASPDAFTMQENQRVNQF